MCFNCFGSHNVDKCTSKNIWLSINCDRKHHTLIHIRFDINPGSINSNIISVHSERTGHVAAVSVQTKNNEMTINTYGDLDMSCRQSILPRSAASELNLDLKVIGQILNSGYQMKRKMTGLCEYVFEVKTVRHIILNSDWRNCWSWVETCWHKTETNSVNRSNISTISFFQKFESKFSQ